MTLIIGHRGVPWEAPENTLASLRLALERGLDGFEYDLQKTRDGDPVLLHDETLERTTDGSGPVEARSMTELFGLDAGSWFGPRFMGEALPAFEEAWAIDRLRQGDGAPLHLIELKDPGLVPAVARVVKDTGRPYSLISFHQNVCTEARDAGLPAMFLADVATEAARRFVRDERIDAFGCGPGGWWAPDAVPDADWPCQRWTWSLDDAAEMLWALRRPLYGFNTNEPDRALSLRALHRANPADDGPPPITVDEALVTGGGLVHQPLDHEPPANPSRAVLEPWTAAWCGDWELNFALRNPLHQAATVDVEPVARGGAFEFHGLPGPIELAPGATFKGRLRLVGGSRSPGPDPRLKARFRWAGEAALELAFDAPITRVREAFLHDGATRLSMLRESPGDPAASVVVSRRGRDLVFRIEDAGGLDNAHLVVRIGPERFGGGRHCALQLRKAHFDAAHARGLAFNVGFTGTRRGAGRFYRFAGGLPPGLFSGAPGRLRLV